MYFIIISILFWMSSILILYSYVFYPLCLFVFYRIVKPIEYDVANITPKVTIIIAAYNEEKVIKSRIENCLLLDYPEDSLEILIASDGSDDKTVKIANEYNDKRFRLLDYKDRRGKVNVLNDAVKEAKNEIIVFSDANTLFKRDAIKKLVMYFNDERVGCVCGGLQFVNASGSKTGELEGFYWRYETMLKKMEGSRGCLLGANGAIFAIRKELYENCPPDTIVEDFYLPMRILYRGFDVIYEPQACAIEEAAHKIVQEKERRIRIGAGDFQALFRLLPMLNPFRGFSAIAFWSHKVLRWFAPFFLILAFITNALLINKQPYLFLMCLQITFYFIAFIGQYLSKLQRNVRLFNLCYYFVSMNVALFLGFCRYISNTQRVAWKRTER